MTRGVRCIGLRAILTLFIVLMSAGVAPLYAEDAGEGTPVSEVPAPTHPDPVDPAPEPADPPVDEGDADPGEGENAPAPGDGEGELPPVDDAVEDPVVDEGAPEEGDVPAGNEPASEEGTVETTNQSSNARMQPQQLGTATFTVDSADQGVAEFLPAGSTWTIIPDPEGKFPNPPSPQTGEWAEDTALPATITTEGIVPALGTHTLVIDAEPTFERYEVPVQGSGDYGTHELVPMAPEVETIPFTLTLTLPDEATAEGVGLRASIAQYGSDFRIDADDAFDLPGVVISGDVTPGDYSLIVSAAGYEPLDDIFTVDEGAESVDLSYPLIPLVEPIPLTLSLALADDAVAEDVSVTWAFGNYDTGDREEGTGFQNIPVTLFDGTVEPGSYWLIVSAAGYEEIRFEGADAITIEEGSEPVAWHFVLEPLPVTEVSVTINVSSLEPDVVNAMPEGSRWTVTHEESGAEWSDTFAEEHLSLPAEITVNDPVPVGNYTVLVQTNLYFENFNDTFTVTGESAEQTFNVELEPAYVDITLAVSSTDEAVANVMPAGSTWVISHTSGDVVVVASGNFGDEPRELPTTEVASLPNAALGDSPLGEYLFSVNATPDFDAYQRVHELTMSLDPINIELEPAVDAPDTFPVMIVANTSDEGSAEGALVTIEDVTGEGVQTFFQVAQIDPVMGVLNADNSFPVQLQAGDYIVTIDGTGQGYDVISAAFSVPVEGDVVALTLTAQTDDGEEPGPAPPPEDEDDSDTPGKKHGKKDPKKPGKDGKDAVEVTELPKTGQGTAATGGTLMLASALASVVAAAGALAIRQKRI